MQDCDKHLIRSIFLMPQVSERAGHIIQYDKFYIHELDDLIDIRNDYVTWIQRQMYPMVSLLQMHHDSLNYICPCVDISMIYFLCVCILRAMMVW